MSSPNSTLAASVENGLALPIAAIVCIVVGLYILLIVIVLVVRYVCMRRGLCKCHCQLVCPELCSGCCQSLSNICDCCQAPSIERCLDAVCPNRKKIDCMKIILCQCCYDENDQNTICNCSGGMINCFCCSVEVSRRDDTFRGSKRLTQIHSHQIDDMHVVDHNGTYQPSLQEPVSSSANVAKSMDNFDLPHFPSAYSLSANVPQDTFSTRSRLMAVSQTQSPPPRIIRAKPMVLKSLEIDPSFTSSGRAAVSGHDPGKLH